MKRPRFWKAAVNQGIMRAIVQRPVWLRLFKTRRQHLPIRSPGRVHVVSQRA